MGVLTVGGEEGDPRAAQPPPASHLPEADHPGHDPGMPPFSVASVTRLVQTGPLPFPPPRLNVSPSISPSISPGLNQPSLKPQLKARPIPAKKPTLCTHRLPCAEEMSPRSEFPCVYCSVAHHIVTSTSGTAWPSGLAPSRWELGLSHGLGAGTR